MDHELDPAFNSLLVLDGDPLEDCFDNGIDLVLADRDDCFDHALSHLNFSLIANRSTLMRLLLVLLLLFHDAIDDLSDEAFVGVRDHRRPCVQIDLISRFTEHLGLRGCSPLSLSLFFTSDLFLLFEDPLAAALSALTLSLPRSEIVDSHVAPLARDSDVSALVADDDFNRATDPGDVGLRSFDNLCTVMADLTLVIGVRSIVDPATPAVMTVASVAMPSTLDRHVRPVDCIGTNIFIVIIGISADFGRILVPFSFIILPLSCRLRAFIRSDASAWRAGDELWGLDSLLSHSLRCPANGCKIRPVRIFSCSGSAEHLCEELLDRVSGLIVVLLAGSLSLLPDLCMIAVDCFMMVSAGICLRFRSGPGHGLLLPSESCLNFLLLVLLLCLSLHFSFFLLIGLFERVCFVLMIINWNTDALLIHSVPRPSNLNSCL